MKSILTTLSFCLLVTPWGIAQNQPPPPPPNILIHVEFVEMSAADTLLLMHGETMPADGQQWRKALEGLFQDGKGKVVGEACVTTRSGQRATAESVDEHIYATEFDPAKGRAEGSPAVPAGLSAVDVPTATSFEMRPAGVRCEVDPVLNQDGTLIDLNLAPELTTYLGDSPTFTLPHETGDRELQKMPRFYSIKVQTSVQVQSGGTALLGIHQPPDENGAPDQTKRVLCFVTARVLKP